jgi:hypothetical protein
LFHWRGKYDSYKKLQFCKVQIINDLMT